jgi:pantoate--beta-alanine ligase
MRTLRTAAGVREHVARARGHGASIALVPTMGAFHAGHVALMAAAREACDEVIVSLFVNPTQFDDPRDLAAYPRDEAADAARAEQAGVDVLFAPAGMYREGHATSIRVAGLGDVLEGEHRGPGHFDGVCTAVCKLLNIVAPDVAYFGQKDAQQVAVIRQMVADLDLPVAIEVVPTVREPDGLAMSSRNVHLGGADRERALGLHAALAAAREAIAAGEREVETIRRDALAALRERDVEPDYLALVHPDTLVPLRRVGGRALVAVAARVGPTRLIDNLLIDTTQAGSTS